MEGSMQPFVIAKTLKSLESMTKCAEGHAGAV